MRRRVALAISIAVAALVFAALAVPVITITVQQLGAGATDVLAPCSKAWVDHEFAIKSNGIVLDKVKVKFDSDLPAGTYIRVELRTANGDLLSSGEVTLDSDLPAGTPITIDLSPDLDIWQILQYDKVDVVVAGPQVTG